MPFAIIIIVITIITIIAILILNMHITIVIIVGSYLEIEDVAIDLTIFAIIYFFQLLK